MVRINLLEPKYLADQHLIAEYYELLVFLDRIKNHQNLENIPKSYRLGAGHLLFFKNKLKYLQNRHQMIREEMKLRGFKPKVKMDLSFFSKKMINDWQPKKKDLTIIKDRIREKILFRPDFYRYYRQKKGPDFFLKLLDHAR